MRRTYLHLIKVLILLTLIGFLCGCGGGWNLVTPGQKAGGGQSQTVDLERDTSAQAQVIKAAQASAKEGNYAGAYNAYSAYLSQHAGGNYAAIAALGAMEALLVQNMASEVIAKADYYRNFLRTKPQAFTYYNYMADAYVKAGQRLNALTATYKALDYAGGYDETAIAEGNIERVLAGLSPLEAEQLAGGGVKLDLPMNDVLFRLGKAAIVNAGNYSLGSQVLKLFMQRYPADPNIPQAEALLAGGTGVVSGAQAVVGCLLPMSGAYERFGKKTLRGVELAMTRFQMLNPGVRVRLIIKDTGGTREQTVSAIQQLAADGAMAIIGPFEEVEAAAETAQGLGMPIMIISQKEGIGKYGNFVFKNFISPQMQAEALIDYAMGKGLSSFAVLYPQENFGRRYMEIFSSIAANKGASVTSIMPYDPNTKADFGPELRNLKQQGYFDAIFLPEGPRKAAMLIPQVHFYDLNKKLLLGTNLWHDESLLNSSGSYLVNAVISDGFAAESGRPAEVWFAAQFEETYNEAPTFIDAITFDSTYLVLKACTAANNDTRAGVRNNLTYMQMPETITGFTGFDMDGEATRNINLLTVSNGEFVYIGAE